MDERKIRLEEARQRALIITDRIRARTDEGIRRRVRNFNTPLNFRGRLEDLAIASEAWDYIGKSRIEPRLVFAHPDLLQAQPQVLKFLSSPVCLTSLKQPPDFTFPYNLRQQTIVSVYVTDATGGYGHVYTSSLRQLIHRHRSWVTSRRTRFPHIRRNQSVFRLLICLPLHLA